MNLRIACLPAITLMGFLSQTSPALGQFQASILRTASYGLRATLDDRPGPGMKRTVLSKNDLAQSFNPAQEVAPAGSIAGAVDGKGHADADLSAYAAVTFGTVKVGVTGSLNATTSASAADLAEGARISALSVNAFADFRDIWRLISPSAAGKDLIVHGRIRLTGNMSVDVTGIEQFDQNESPLNKGSVSITAYIKSNGIVHGVISSQFPQSDGLVGRFDDYLEIAEPYNNSPEMFFDVMTPTREGVPANNIISLRLVASGEIETNAGGDAVRAFFAGDYRNTLVWQGITKVTDAQTGEEINDWTLTSDSGFDYVHGVPEPTGLLILVQAAGACLCLRRHHRSRPPRGSLLAISGQ
jgi:hypothetical protein